jgi:hypothetical protein
MLDVVVYIYQRDSMWQEGIYGTSCGCGPKQPSKGQFDCRVRIGFGGSQLSSDAGFLVFLEMDDALGFCDLARTVLTDDRAGKKQAAVS